MKGASVENHHIDAIGGAPLKLIEKHLKRVGVESGELQEKAFPSQRLKRGEEVIPLKPHLVNPFGLDSPAGDFPSLNAMEAKATLVLKKVTNRSILSRLRESDL